MLATDQTYDCRDRRVLSKLYAELRPYALKKCHYVLADLALAQDVVQDVFIRLCNDPVIFHSLAAAYRWVYTCCHNASIDKLRSLKRQESFVSKEITLSIYEDVGTHDRLANQQVVRQILHHFSEREAEVLIYIAVDGLSHREIAELLGVSAKTIQRTVGAIEQKLTEIRRKPYER